MTILETVGLAAPFIGIAKPTALFSATDRTSLELQAAVNEAAKGIAEDFDWQRLRFIQTMTGDGSYTAFDLPSDYARMLKKAELCPSDAPNTPLIHIVDTDEWLRLEVQNAETVNRRWTIYQNQIHIKPVLTSGVAVKFFYISNKLVISTGQASPDKAAFTADTDGFFVDERLLKQAIIWRWKQAKGRPYAEDLETYERTKDILAGTDKGSKSIHIGTRRIPSGVTLSYPGTISG